MESAVANRVVVGVRRQSLYLPEALMQTVERRAKAEGRSVSNFVRVMLERQIRTDKQSAEAV